MKVMYDICGGQKRWYVGSETTINGAKIVTYESGYFPTEKAAEDRLKELERVC